MTIGLVLDWLNILDFKEEEDADYTVAFRRAIAAIRARGGGVLYIPSGTYDIRPTPAISLCSNLTIMGDGAQSIVRVADGTGSYKVIFGQENSTEARVDSVYFERFTIDQNPTGNPVPSSSGASQFTFSFKNFSKVHFRKMEFNPTTGANAICCNASRGSYIDTTCQDVTVEQCRFYRVSPNQVYVDNSAIYLNCPGSIVSNNKFYAFDDETIRAKGCIETHGGKSVISGNYSEGYSTGVNAASRMWGKESESGQLISMVPANITISGNTFTKVKKRYPTMGQPSRR
ncbi:glycosyl hydrolase family 28-related protein [Listeria cornellensis]|uniref:Endopolygalacturonase n=1 Tax=Listeria cornellensis FSL F6-0969 TaxID=1265820 RepID=W7C3H8_9LIST|nr:glycosyl hydrolase family 28-related protein [Listeria cornellensis]EUJ31647.1 endopolygalacturonase [Listeria cornellensis FSL F6-0969]